LIESITQDGVVTVDKSDEHNLSDGDYVRFEEVEGMVELNDREFLVQVIDYKSFLIGDCSSFHPYTCQKTNGYGNQIIMPIPMSFKSLREALANPEFSPFESSDVEDGQILLCFWTLFRIIERKIPLDISVFLDTANEVNAEFHWTASLDERVAREFVRQDGVICPMAAIFGGIVGQEILKSVSGKFIPFSMFMVAGCLHALPDASQVSYEPVGDRLDVYRRIFGNEQIDRMSALRYFLVGAGAIGCELLKNWALMGIGSSAQGKVFVTDMDQIERSNLNRQFLFRNADIGKMKSVTAAAAAAAINPAFNVEAHTNRIGEESEAVYDSEFYRSLDGVCNAIDNREGRRYNDRQCVFFEKPLMESGTLGPLGHFEPIIPRMTVSYSYFKDPPGKGIPECTLHSFPTNINHCTMWARDVFGGLFTRDPSIVNQWMRESGYVKRMLHSDPGALLDNLRTIEQLLLTEKPKDFQDCAAWEKPFSISFTGDAESSLREGEND
jgi:ubiquitin-activating enzyme E1